MAKYTSLPAESGFAIDVLKTNYIHINKKFILFFDDLIIHVKNEIEIAQNPIIEKKMLVKS